MIRSLGAQRSTPSWHCTSPTPIANKPFKSGGPALERAWGGSVTHVPPGAPAEPGGRPGRNAGMRECGNAAGGERPPGTPRLFLWQQMLAEGTQLGLVPACPSRGDPLLSAVPAARDDGQMSVRAETDSKNCPEPPNPSALSPERSRANSSLTAVAQGWGEA
ncbi:uncharacterized protein LOC120512931 isoform X2 [Passer montanus]|uniref:uncharacterized protein LOC120512931 isoform X2 n=1 Tax=Passer montanus TaxID=9160 RepID=UPI0019603115|nr:uncharacterized protein LOC120512931 isoform X2 [Passer montanus]